jgi:hypothetical protein
MNHDKFPQQIPTPAAPPSRKGGEPIRLQLQLRWEGFSGRHAARLYALNRVGCFIETLGHVHNGEFIWFEVQSPTGRWVQLQGEVMRAHPRAGFMLRFLGLSERQACIVGELVDYARVVSAPSLEAPTLRQAA